MYLNKEKLFGNSKCKFLLVEDDNEISGVKLFKTLLNLFCGEGVDISALCYDLQQEELVHGLNASQFKFYETFSDIFNVASEIKGVLCIQSLSTLITLEGLDVVYKHLHKLINNSEMHIVALLHTDVHDENDVDKFHRLASTILNVSVEGDGSKMRSTVHYTNGKVSSHLLDYEISPTFQFVTLTDAKFQARKAAVKKPDPTANLTFNLKLKDMEKEMKDNVQLPYLKVQTTRDIPENLLQDDMYDEEDPDDDLDI